MTQRISRRVLCLAAILALVGCGAPADRPTGEALLLVTLDTLRGDRVGCGGDPAARTPGLDRLARTGLQFPVAVASVPLTLPSHATILSGLTPPEHGARNNGFYRVEDDVPLLPEALSRAGWETAAFVAAFPLARRFGLARGFATYHDTGGMLGDASSGYAERPADRVTDDVETYLAARTDERPLFLWVHYFDPHAPFVPHAPFARRSGVDRYAGEVEFADRQMRRLLGVLEQRFTTVRVCVVADHGESLGDHGEDSHGIFVYESTTRVPLVFSGEGVRRGALEALPASVTRIAPSLLSWVGVDPVGAGFVAHPLPEVGPSATPDAATGDRDEPIYVESLLPQLRLGWAPLRGLRTSRWKVIQAPEPEIYDLARDPGERTNLYDDEATRATVADLLTRIESAPWTVRDTRPEEVDEPTAALLESLGYVGGARAFREGGRDLPDPKQAIAINRPILEASAFLAAGQLVPARQAISRALSVDSRHKEAYLLLARIEAESGNPEGALSYYDYCLTLPPPELDPVVNAGAGRVALDAGWPERAEPYLERAVHGNPLDADALFNWGAAAFRQGRYGDAAARWREVLRLDPDHSSARQWLPEAEAKRTETSP